MTGGRRDSTVLALGSAGSGLLAYLVFALTTRAIGSEAAAPVSVLWSLWAFAGAAFTFPVQHWIARSATAHGEGDPRRAMPRVAAVVAGLALALGTLTWLVREQLFHRGDLWFPAMVALVIVGSAVTGVVRGTLSARERFGAVAVSLVAENGVRCLAVVVLASSGVKDPVGYGLCLVVGPLAMAAWPSAFRLGRGRTSSGHTSPLAFLAGAGLAQLVNQVVLTGGPVVLALSGGSQHQVTALFAALALYRAPYILALGLVSQLTTRVTVLVVGREVAVLHRIRRLLVILTGAAALAAAALGWWLGPSLLPLIFGDDVVLGAGLSALTATACAIAVGNLVGTVTVLAQDQASALARAWLLALLVAAIVLAALTSVLSPLERTVVAFVAAEVAAFALLWWVESRGTRALGASGPA